MSKLHTTLRLCIATMLASVACVVSATSLPSDSLPTDYIIERPAARHFAAEVGYASMLDTYLSPITYTGVHIRPSFQSTQAMRFNPKHWVMQMDAGVDYSNLTNPAGNHVIHSLNANFAWGMMRRWRQPLGIERLQLFCGPQVEFRGGLSYSIIGSNNPVSVKIRLSAGLMGAAAYSTRIASLPITLRYEASLPVFGAFFSPHYGESFYEIYVGNTANLVHFGWWGCRFDLTHRCFADMHLGNTLLRIGYGGRIESSWICNLSTRVYTHSLIIGVGGEWLGMKPGSRTSEKAEIISSMY